MKTNLTNKSVWITGASAGIGAKTAQRMADEGCKVWASARSEDKLSALGRGIKPLALDVTDLEATKAAVSAIGSLDCAVLNAGVYWPRRSEDFDAQDYHKHYQVNVQGVANGLEAVLPGMIARGQGQVAIVSSVAGYRGLPYAGAYAMTKAGLIAMAESLRPELEAKGIKIQVITPGFVRTDATSVNDFDMPFIIEADKAADYIWKGLQSSRFEVAFPRRMAWSMKFLEALPYWAFFSATKRMLTER